MADSDAPSTSVLYGPTLPLGTRCTGSERVPNVYADSLPPNSSEDRLYALPRPLAVSPVYGHPPAPSVIVPRMCRSIRVSSLDSTRLKAPKSASRLFDYIGTFIHPSARQVIFSCVVSSTTLKCYRRTALVLPSAAMWSSSSHPQALSEMHYEIKLLIDGLQHELLVMYVYSPRLSSICSPPIR